jgi:pimeloyl-ACP methyl ester carboxylesterase
VGTGIRFFESSIGARIAFATAGSGPPIILVPAWTGHLELSTEISGFWPFHDRLATQHTVIRYDRWGTGLSDRDRRDFSMDADIQVLVELADHLRLRRFAVFGPSHGGPVAVAVALAQPRRVSHLVLYATRAQALTDSDTWAAMRDLMLADWILSRRAMAAVALEGASAEDIEAFARLGQEAASPEVTIGLQDAAMSHDLRSVIDQVRVPTLVVQRRDDPFVSVEDARWLATRIPGATLELLDGSAHVHVVGDSAAIAERINSFGAGGGGRRTAQLTAREREVLQLVAEGCTNAEAAERLVLSVRTVERHLLNAYTKLNVRGRAEATAAWLTADR